jgi:hypothetical protein
MIDMQRLYELVDQLPRRELEQLNRYIHHRRLTTVWEVAPEEIKAIEVLMRPTHELTTAMDEDDINNILDEAIAEVRRERKTKNGT